MGTARSARSLVFAVASRLREAELLLWAMVAAALVLRLPYLDESIGYDELWSTRVRLAPWATLLDTIWRDVHPPLYSLLLAGWVGVFGDSEVSIRIPPLLAGLAALPVLFSLARRFVPHATALLATFLLAVSPVHIWYSREARPYSVLLLLTLLTLLAYYRWRERPGDRRRMWLYLMAALAASMTHYFVVGLLGVLTLLAFIQARRIWPRLMLVHIAVLSAVALVILNTRAYLLAFDHTSHLRAFPLPELWMLMFNWFAVGNTWWRVGPIESFAAFPLRAEMIALQLCFAALFAIGTVAIFRRSRHRLDLPLLLLGVPAGLLALTLAGSRDVFLERSLMLVLPLFLVLLAAGATAFRSPVVTAICVSLLLVVNVLSVGQLFAKIDTVTVGGPTTDWRGVADYLRVQPESDRPIRPAFALSGLHSLRYYGVPEQFVRHVAPDTYLELRQAMGRRIVTSETPLNGGDTCKLFAFMGGVTFSIVIAGAPSGQQHALATEVLADRRCELIERRTFGQATVYTFRAAG